MSTPKTCWIGGPPYPADAPAPKPVARPQHAPQERPDFSFVLAIRKKPGILTSELVKKSRHLRTNVVRTLAREARNGVVHSEYVSVASRRQLAWFPGRRATNDN